MSHEAAGGDLGSRVPIFIRFCLCVYVCLEGRAKIWDEMGLAEHSGSAAGQLLVHLFCVCLCAVLLPKNLVCPGARNWGKWNSGAVNRQTECLSPAARRTHSADIYITYMHTYFPQTDLQPNQAKIKTG